MTEELRLSSTTQEEPTSGGPPAEPGSIVARLREKAKQQQAVKRIDIPVGGEFGEHLVIRYKPLPPAAMDSFVARGIVRAEEIPFTDDTMDMMARCCVEVIGRYGDEEVVLEDADGPVRLEHRLAVLLDFPRAEGVKMTSHEVILALFANNGPMLGEHSATLMKWMTGKGDEEDLGE